MSSPRVGPLYLLLALSMATQFGTEAPITVQGGPGYAATDSSRHVLLSCAIVILQVVKAAVTLIKQARRMTWKGPRWLRLKGARLGTLAVRRIHPDRTEIRIQHNSVRIVTSPFPAQGNS